VTGGERYPVRTRILHWLTAILVFGALLIGFAMVNSLGSYAALIGIHMTIGATILVVVVIRAANRFTHKTPTLPESVGRVERLMVLGSELAMYALLLAQPLVGWAMVSAAGNGPVLFGTVALPRIAPFDANLYFVLRQTHTVLAFLLVAVIAAHVSAVLLHTLSLRDGMLSRMTFGRNARSERRGRTTAAPARVVPPGG
jgi:cytochrome b561